MNGIEILSQSEVVVEGIFNWKAFWITVAIIGAMGFIVSVFSLREIGWDVIAIATGVILILGIVLGVAIGYAFEKPITYEAQYKVTISDEVKMNDFLEQYEIIDQEGKIYTVREKE